MAIDSSIAMGVQPMKIDSPMNALAQMMQIKHAQQQTQLGELTMQDHQRTYDDTNKLNQLYSGALGADGTIDRTALYRNAASGGLGSKIPGLQKGFLDTDKAQVEVDAQKFKLASDRHAIYQKSLGSLAQEPGLSKDMVMQAGQSLVQQGILPAELFAKSMQTLPDDPEQLRARLTQGMKSQLTPEQIFTVFAPKPEKIDDGGQISFMDMNPNSRTYGKPVGTAVEKVQSPDSLSANKITMRGQDMTASTAKDGRNQPHYDENLGWVGQDGAVTPRTVNGAPIVGGGKALTENQGKAVALGMRAMQAMETLKGLDDGGFDALNLKDRYAAATPFDLARGAMSGKGQQYENAQRNFISAVLRKESGAVISDQEFANERKKYFPQVGDGPDVMTDKAQQRLLAIEGLKAEAGQQGAQTMAGAPIQRAESKNKGVTRTWDAPTADVSGMEAEMRRRGLLK